MFVLTWALDKFLFQVVENSELDYSRGDQKVFSRGDNSGKISKRKKKFPQKIE